MPQREFDEPLEKQALAAALAKNWTDDPVVFVRNFANLVYKIPTTPASYLRITPDTHRSTRAIQSELQILQHVAARGIHVAAPVESRSAELVHVIAADNVRYSACVFREAQVSFFEESPPSDGKAFFREVGRTMGLLHGALSNFEQLPEFERFEWSDDRWGRFAEFVPETEVEAWELFTELRNWTNQLSIECPSFGLIHGDFTIENMRIRESQLTLFDFDACCNHWRAYEIATFLHYFGGRDAESRALAYDNVLSGYAEVHPVTTILLQQIPLFGKMRLLYSFLVFAEQWGFKNLAPNQHAYFALRRNLFRSAPTWPGSNAV